MATIRDIIIDELIEERLLKIQSKLLDNIDKKLEDLHRVISGKYLPLQINLKDVDEAKEFYKELVEGRKAINVPLDDFKNLKEDQILNATCYRAKPLKDFIKRLDLEG